MANSSCHKGWQPCVWESRALSRGIYQVFVTALLRMCSQPEQTPAQQEAPTNMVSRHSSWTHTTNGICYLFGLLHGYNIVKSGCVLSLAVDRKGAFFVWAICIVSQSRQELMAYLMTLLLKIKIKWWDSMQQILRRPRLGIRASTLFHTWADAVSLQGLWMHLHTFLTNHLSLRHSRSTGHHPLSFGEQSSVPCVTCHSSFSWPSVACTSLLTVNNYQYPGTKALWTSTA